MGTKDGIVKKRYLGIYKEEMRCVKKCIYQSKTEISGQICNKTSLWKELCKINEMVEKCKVVTE